MLPKISHGAANFGDIYNSYDYNNDNTLSQSEMVTMMVDAGMKYATDAEAKFVHDYISNFKKFITPTTFNNWGESFRGLP